MKRKKVLSMLVASTLAATTMAVPVMAAGDTIDVEVATKTAPLRVTVPTTLAIAVDQLEMGNVGTQIYSDAFTMANNSSVDVKVSIESTADLKNDTKLVYSKAAAESSVTKGEAWLAVAAQVDSGKYIASGDIKDLTETSANVTTFGQDANKATAKQTFYLAKTTGAYKLLNAGEDASKISYAQFYELTAATTASDQDKLDALLAEKDVYVATAAAANGQTLTLKEKGDTHTYAAGEVYYTANTNATEKGDINASKLYVYADGTVATGGSAAFRYIGKLSPLQDSWSAEDISDVHITYDIVGVQGSKYNDIKAACTYGLYAPLVSVDTAGLVTVSNLSADRNFVTANIELSDGAWDIESDKVEWIGVDGADATWSEAAGGTLKIQLGDGWKDSIKSNGGAKIIVDLSDGSFIIASITIS